MTFKEAAVVILRGSRAPMTPRSIYERAVRAGYIKSRGKTPVLTMATQLYTDISRNGRQSLFEKTAPGLFHLKSKRAAAIRDDISPTT